MKSALNFNFLGSGVVEFEEFVQFIKRLMKNMDPENECREAFRRSIYEKHYTFLFQV